MMRSSVTLLLSLIYCFNLGAQDGEHPSIHQLESKLYGQMGNRTAGFYDSLNAFRKVDMLTEPVYGLSKKVFGYHPYWGGSNYLNYQWNLMTDLCHFSYEVDPETGLPVTTHNWESSPALDSAVANGVRIHLCVTLFSGHSAFFSNEVAQQTLIDQLIELLQQRNAHGVNIDVEALPSIFKEEFLEFMIALSEQLQQHYPIAELSIAAPAVNWSDKFNIPVLNNYIDFFMVMAYDYYWGGSSMAGPVSPLYPMVSYSTYCFSRSISYYQAQGVPLEKLVMGVPYYAYQWKTEGPLAPSATIGQGAAYTYRYVTDNASGNYSPENKRREPNSLAPYFSFESNGWNQCFMDDKLSMGKKFDIVNRRGLAGIGIWALGYDNGYTDFWDLIAEKFSEIPVPVNADTIFDSGGPAFDYYNDEHYCYHLNTAEGSNLYLSFSYLDTEENYDTLWLYDGADTNAPLLGIYSGDQVPELIQASANALTLRFFSDGATVDAGWRAVYDTLPVSSVAGKTEPAGLSAFPNPADQLVHLDLPVEKIPVDARLVVYDSYGRMTYRKLISWNDGSLSLNVSRWPNGVYMAFIEAPGVVRNYWKFVVKH